MLGIISGREGQMSDEWYTDLYAYVHITRSPRHLSRGSIEQYLRIYCTLAMSINLANEYPTFFFEM